MRRFFKQSRPRAVFRPVQPQPERSEVPTSNISSTPSGEGIDPTTELVWNCFGRLYLELLAVEGRRSGWADFAATFQRLRPEIEANIRPEARSQVKQELDHAEREMKRRHTAQTHYRLHEAALRAL